MVAPPSLGTVDILISCIETNATVFVQVINMFVSKYVMYRASFIYEISDNFIYYLDL